jgi:transcriptional regulator with XRE-family HTH domain
VCVPGDVMDLETSGQRVARARRRRGLSQAVLVGLVGRSESWLSQVERGRRAIDSHAVLTRLANVPGMHSDLRLRYRAKMLR